MSGTILLTGAQGFTGQQFAQEATRHGYKVIALEANLLDAEGIVLELADVHIDYVVHLAAISAVTHADELALYQVNLFGTLNLLQALSKAPTVPGKILVASSANIYGNSPVSPISELAPPAPPNHYAMSKLAMEYMLEKYTKDLPIVIVRPFNYTGVGHDDRFVIPKLVHHFRNKNRYVEMGNMSVEREFNDVRTVCTAYLQLLTHGVPNEAYNICSGNTHSLGEVVDTLTRLSGHEIEIRINPDFVRANDVQRLCGDPAKLESCIGTLEHPPLEDTLRWMLTA